MKREELNSLKRNIAENKEKATDLDILISEIMKLPYVQLKEVLTDEAMAVLNKYGYTE